MALGMRFRLAGTLAALTLVILALVLLALRLGQRGVDAEQAMQTKAVLPAYQLSTLARALVRQRVYLSRMTADPQSAELPLWRAEVKADHETVTQTMAALNALLPSNPELAPGLRDLGQKLSSYRATKQRALALLEGGQFERARQATEEDVYQAGRQMRLTVDAEIEAVEQRTELRLAHSAQAFGQERWQLIALSALAVLAAVGLGWHLVNSIMVPVRRMSEALRAIGAGDLTARVAVYRHDEFGQLAQAINEMGMLVQAAAERDHRNAEQQRLETERLRCGVDGLLGVTEAAANGDLTRRPGALEGEQMQRLAASVDSMVGGLRKLVGDLQGGMLQIRGCTTDLSASVRDSESTLAEQATSSTEVAATSTEMAQNANELATTMHRVSSTNEGALQRAVQGRESLQRLDSTMAQILAASADISSELVAMATRSTDTTSVVTAITRVADQTNLLSLNAAIEAEKAGEYGPGFSVTAGEIRRLSDQTTEAAGHIEQIVREMHSAITSSVLGLDRFNEQVRRNVDDVGVLGGVLTGVIESVEALAPRVESASESMRAQADGAAQINEAIRQIHGSITHAHRSMRTTSEATQALNAVAQQLQFGISRFRLA